MEEDTRGIIAVIDRSKDLFSVENKRKMLYSVDVFLDRLERAINFCDCDYMLIMEPDVLVRGKLNIPKDSVYLGNK